MAISGLGIILAAAYFLGVFLFWRWGRRDGFSSEGMLDLAILSSLGGLAGGKLFPLLFGGAIELSWVGTLGAGFGVFFLYTWVKRWSFFRLADRAAWALSFGQAGGLAGAGIWESPAWLLPAGGFLLLGFALFFLNGRVPKGTSFFIYLVLSGLLLYFFVRIISAQALTIVGVVGLAGIAIREWFKIKRSHGPSK